MDIHPEVSTGTVDANGIPSQTTTEVTTRLLVASGDTIFIGGLIKQGIAEVRSGVPILGRIPGIGLLFSSRESISINTETIVMITPQLVGEVPGSWNTELKSEIEGRDRQLMQNAIDIDNEMNQTFFGSSPAGQTDSLMEAN